MGFRKSQPYEIYSELKFDIPSGTNGDCYDRYLIRIFEMRESLKIIEQCLENIPVGIIKTNNNKITPPSRKDIKRIYGIFNTSFQNLYSRCL